MFTDINAGRVGEGVACCILIFQSISNIIACTKIENMHVFKMQKALHEFQLVGGSAADVLEGPTASLRDAPTS